MLKRELYLKKIRPFYNNELVKVIVGIRRCGKSVLMQQIIEELIVEGVSPEQIIYLNFENLEYAQLNSAMALHEFVTQQIEKGKKYYLFFDEIQVVDQWEKAINSFRVAFDCDIYITGSNSNLLSGELASLLSGRYVSFQIYPFSFVEVCAYQQKVRQEITDNDLMNYIRWGGMPQQLQFQNESEKRVFLHDLYNSIVLQDIIARNNLKNVGLLNRVVEYLAATPSQVFSVTSVSKYFESINIKISTETLYNYLEYISMALFVQRAKQYDIRGKRLLTRNDKLYLTDLGFATIMNSEMKVELGALLENVVHNELLVRGYQVYVGKTPKGEIDFIATKDGKKEYYQVAYLLATEEVIKREFGAFDGITDNYPKYVITMDSFDFSREGIVHKNMIDFLLEKDGRPSN